MGELELRRTHRISAGAIVIKDGKILLVRYRDKNNKVFLVAPGGGVHMNESLPDAAVREVREETGIIVNPNPCKILFVEEFLSDKYRHIKVWILGKLEGGTLSNTLEAKKESIIEAGWFSKSALANEVVYPSILNSIEWSEFEDKTWKTRYIGLGKSDFKF
jgi:8-oxo-dGTP diphosphatase